MNAVNEKQQYTKIINYIISIFNPNINSLFNNIKIVRRNNYFNNGFHQQGRKK